MYDVDAGQTLLFCSRHRPVFFVFFLFCFFIIAGFPAVMVAISLSIAAGNDGIQSLVSDE